MDWAITGKLLTLTSVTMRREDILVYYGEGRMGLGVGWCMCVCVEVGFVGVIWRGCCEHMFNGAGVARLA